MLHGFEHMHKDAEGYVYWKGKHVEHYSFGHDVNEKTRESEQTRDLVARCQHIESLGLPVNSSTVIWRYSWFADMTPAHPYLPMLRELRPEFYESPDRRKIAWMHDPCPPAEWPYRHTATLRIWDGTQLTNVSIESDNLGNWYHPLRDAGWITAQAGQTEYQGLCYASTQGITDLLTRHNFPVDPSAIAKPAIANPAGEGEPTANP